MKNKIKLTLVAALTLGATSAFATNGSNLIATGSQARSMGGTGIGVSHGAESGLANVALITTVEETEVSFGGMFFIPKVKNTNNINLGTMGDDSGSGTSGADLNVIPEVAVASKVNENLYLGMGIWGTAGLGVDYRGDDNTGQMEMVTNLQLMQFATPIAYKKNGFSIGFTPILQYGALDINYNMSAALRSAMAQTQVTEDKTVGTGMSQDLEFGYDIGIAYQKAGFTIGAIYKSQIDMTYQDVLPTAIGEMGVNYTNEELSTPAEMGIGISYAFNKNTIALDYKKIKWSDAKGYQDFDWDDQNVFAIGYEYAEKKWAIRLGYNYAKSPISEQEVMLNEQGQDTNINSAGLPAGLVNTFNTLGFPGIMTTHYTFGGNIQLAKQTKLAVAYVYAPQEEVTYKNFLNQDSTTKHKQSSLSFDIVYDF